MGFSRMKCAMDVTISLPEDISESLAGQWGNVSRHALETIAVEGRARRSQRPCAVAIPRRQLDLLTLLTKIQPYS